MPVIEMNGHQIHVDDEGFLTDYDEWDEDLAKVLAAAIGVDLTDEQRALTAELRAYFSTLVSTSERRVMLTERHGPVYREVIRRMGAAAQEVSLLALEIGDGQAEATVQLLGGHGFRTELHRDLAGVERVVVGRK